MFSPCEMPYSNVDLTPHWNYDLEKAMLFSCPATSNKLILGLGIGLGLLFVLTFGVAMIYFKKNKDLEANYVAPEKAV